MRQAADSRIVSSVPRRGRGEPTRFDRVLRSGTCNRQPATLVHDLNDLVAQQALVVTNADDATKETRFIDVSLSSGNNTAMITITDNGAGMSPGLIRERLFRSFDSARGSRSTGIGACRAHGYVRRLGRQIDVTSTPGQGSRFETRRPTE